MSKVARIVHVTHLIPDTDFVGPPPLTALVGIHYSSESGKDYFEISCVGENSVSILTGDPFEALVKVSWEQWIDIRRSVDAVFSEMDRLKNTNKWFCHQPKPGTHEWGIGSCRECGYRLIKVKKSGFLFCSNHETICDYEQ